MKKTDRDNEVFEDAKKHIKTNLQKGDMFTTSEIQRRFRTGYNLATRVLDMLAEENIIKLDKNRIKAPKVL